MLQRLKDRVRQYNPSADLRRIDEAFAYGAQHHAGQKRASGDDFIAHPVAVAYIVADLELDEPTVIAALLHDVVEDTDADLEEVRRLFGHEVALLVDGVTKLSRLNFKSRVEEQAENLRKMFLAMAKDIRVILIKLADRLHNMRTLSHVEERKQQAKARETLEIFAPLAHRLGISRIQWELEDLALQYLEPERYRDLAERIPRQRAEREALIQDIMAQIRRRLAEVGIEADIQGRAKHLYSIYRKVYEQGKDLSEIYDLVAVRIIVHSLKDCYGALGVVHTMWRPLPGRFKDYIATPKSNMYQSLHTTVVGPGGEPFEVQIRTWEMHRTAEYGIAAHWRYKEGTTASRDDFDAKLSWLREILEWQSDLRDAREFMESLKLDVFSDEVFVFTPKGDVIELPAGSTPIDFAYRIHTEVGHHCVGAKVNGRLVPIDHRLDNGDIVEIITSKQSAGPSRDWLALVKTNTAKNRIRQFLKRQRREENLERGREALEREARSQGVRLSELWTDEAAAEVGRKLGYTDPDDLLVAVGYGGVTAAQVVGRLKELYRERTRVIDEAARLAQIKRRTLPPGDPTEAVQVKGIDNVLVRLSRCCSPVPGDDIVGYITRGRGVSIHQRSCPNLARLVAEDANRLIDVAWESVQAAYYPVHMVIHGIDRPGLLSDIAHVVADTRTNILSARARAGRDGSAYIDLILEIRGLDQYDYIRRQIERVRDVLSVERVSGKEMH
ncbi:MAG: bifunctional (p)ppGpp synthetase/guanosine-3',5'-bis(diphosphate) 3'-pyrophosphohydrolase [Thermaerobacter sp.]|nr:(p)ppGpp synthetase [Bacillota bacterium]